MFLSFVDGAEVEIRHHADTVIPAADQRIQHVRHAGVGFVLNVFEDLIAFTGSGRDRLARADAVGQQISRLINHANFAGVQPRNAAGNQMHNGVHLVHIQLRAVVQTHHHRGAVLRLIADHKRAFFVERQMHPRALHRVQRHNALRQLPFEAAFIAHVLHELAAAKHFVFVHQLVAAGQNRLHTFGGKGHARFRQRLFRHQYLPALRVNAVGELFAVQHGDNLRHGQIFLASVERDVAAIAGPQHANDNRRRRHGKPHTRHQRPAFVICETQSKRRKRLG